MRPKTYSYVTWIAAFVAVLSALFFEQAGEFRWVVGVVAIVAGLIGGASYLIFHWKDNRQTDHEFAAFAKGSKSSPREDAFHSERLGKRKRVIRALAWLMGEEIEWKNGRRPVEEISLRSEPTFLGDGPDSSEGRLRNLDKHRATEIGERYRKVMYLRGRINEGRDDITKYLESNIGSQVITDAPGAGKTSYLFLSAVRAILDAGEAPARLVDLNDLVVARTRVFQEPGTKWLISYMRNRSLSWETSEPAQTKGEARYRTDELIRRLVTDLVTDRGKNLECVISRDGEIIVRPSARNRTVRLDWQPGAPGPGHVHIGQSGEDLTDPAPGGWTEGSEGAAAGDVLVN